ncbi:MAG: hypothetical protein ACPGSD_15315 [Flavobacteriales bacterium]
MKNTHMIDSLILAIQTDQTLLTETESKISELKEEKRAIADRLRESKNDTLVLLKYLDDDQRKKIDALNLDLDTSSTRKELNSVAQKAYEIILKHKDNRLTNLELFDAYLKSVPKDEEAFNYTAFNIKCRSLFNTQKLIRTKGSDPKSSKTDMISLNGKVNEANSVSKK